MFVFFLLEFSQNLIASGWTKFPWSIECAICISNFFKPSYLKSLSRMIGPLSSTAATVVWIAFSSSVGCASNVAKTKEMRKRAKHRGRGKKAWWRKKVQKQKSASHNTSTNHKIFWIIPFGLEQLFFCFFFFFENLQSPKRFPLALFRLVTNQLLYPFDIIVKLFLF